MCKLFLGIFCSDKECLSLAKILPEVANSMTISFDPPKKCRLCHIYRILRCIKRTFHTKKLSKITDARYTLVIEKERLKIKKIKRLP